MNIQHIEIALFFLKEADNALKEAFDSAYDLHNYKDRIESLMKDCKDIIDHYKECNHGRVTGR